MDELEESEGNSTVQERDREKIGNDFNLLLLLGLRRLLSSSAF
jgi:hypothetical protein